MHDAHKRRLDAVVVWKFDRLARSVSHLLTALETFNPLAIAFVSLSESVEYASREDGIHSMGSRRGTGAFVDWRESPGGTAECESQGNSARPTAAKETYYHGDSDDAVGSPQQANPVCCACREVRHERLERLPSLQKCKMSFGVLAACTSA